MARPAAKWSTAYSRFGFGPHGISPRISGDARETIDAELAAPEAGVIRREGLRTGPEAVAAFYDLNAQKARELKEQAAKGEPSPRPVVAMPVAAEMSKTDAPKTPPPPSPLQTLFLDEATARIEAACAAPVGFVERLVAFWSNHFCVSGGKGLVVRATAGPFEREAIRPHVLGRFADMLLAAERHPAMLFYLDNAQSIGPNSPVGKKAKKGLNENFGREILELHTLGVDGGYAQADVTELARALTGWTVAGRDGKIGTPGAFVFNANSHERGERALLGRKYPEGGVEQGETALADIARAPATARHIATKFARAFVADHPTPQLVDHLAKTFADTDGDLAALARALLDDDSAWRAPALKFRDPWEMMIAAYRAFGLDASKPNRILSSMTLLGMPLWSPGGPNGYSNAAEAWVSPEGIKTRVQVATGLGRLVKDAPAPSDLLERILPDASELTRQTFLRAGSREQAYALMILSPEFQRR